jgi:hypothetical protein
MITFSFDRRLIEAEAANFPPRSSKRAASPATSPKPKRRKKKKKNKDDDEDSDEDDEVASFKARPSAAVNRPMILQPVDKIQKNAIELSLAAIDPNASFAERVQQFDNMEAIAKKRKSRSHLKKKKQS